VDSTLGILGLVAFIVAVVALAAAVTYAVIRVSPSQSAKELKGEANDG
jgi:hypothetical protein